MSAIDHPRASEGNGAPAGPEPDRVTNDRGVSPIAGRPGGLRSRWITLAALAAGCGAFLFATWDRGDRPARPAPEEHARERVPFEPVRRPAEPPLLSMRPGDPDAPSLTGQPMIPVIDDVTPSPPGHVASASEEHRRSLAESARRAPVLAYSRSGVHAVQPPAALPPSAVPAPDSGPSTLDQLRQISSVRRAEAGRLPDRRFLIIAGTTVPCLLQTAMDSDAPGYVSCIVPRDVWSDDGSVVLMPRGTRVLGEYRSGLQRGRGRLFVLWTRAVTPEGVAIALASPAADALGRAGIGGRIDSHFRERFSGALLLSIVDGATMAAVDAGADRSIIRTPSDAASIALQDSVGIPPTLRKDQGAEVSILVAQDLDFSSVYRLRPR